MMPYEVIVARMDCRRRRAQMGVVEERLRRVGCAGAAWLNRSLTEVPPAR